jgi:hypothetical protein
MGRRHGVRLYSTARFPEGGNMVNVDTESHKGSI